MLKETPAAAGHRTCNLLADALTIGYCYLTHTYTHTHTHMLTCIHIHTQTDTIVKLQEVEGIKTFLDNVKDHYLQVTGLVAVTRIFNNIIIDIR